MKKNTRLKSFRNFSGGLLIMAFLLGGFNLSAFSQTSGKASGLPVKYDEHRFYVQPETSDGTTLNFFTDTGGGLFLFSDVVERLKLPVKKGEMENAPETVSASRF